MRRPVEVVLRVTVNRDGTVADAAYVSPGPGNILRVSRSEQRSLGSSSRQHGMVSLSGASGHSSSTSSGRGPRLRRLKGKIRAIPDPERRTGPVNRGSSRMRRFGDDGSRALRQNPTNLCFSRAGRSWAGGAGSAAGGGGSSIMGVHRNVRELRFFERDLPRNTAICAAVGEALLYARRELKA